MKIRVLAFVLPSMLGLAVPAFAQPIATDSSPVSASQINAATIVQLHQEVRDLKLEEASLRGYHIQPAHNGTNYQTAPDVTEARLQNQIGILQGNIVYLRSADTQRAEKNTHMLTEMGING